ncbi:hypothetical protein [Burkholderia sp. NLJ2]|uniref:hypothetical protein n=1 Tax=Burkholderia sp. NLJ2 TaxID=3090699 RepID=UPI003C6C2009
MANENVSRACSLMSRVAMDRLPDKAHGSTPATKNACPTQLLRLMFSDMSEKFLIKHSCFQQVFNDSKNP